MKELLRKGDANVPKRSVSYANAAFTMQTPQPEKERNMSIGAASFKAAGFVSYENSAGNKSKTIDSGMQSPTSSVPAPI